ncbi:MAG TPA: ATP-binding protein [Spirochaetota bacterium]|nr:ATP-binding protein [Spirochaetota bacterium]
MGVQIGILASENNVLKNIVSILTNLYNANKDTIDKITVVNLKEADKAYDFINFEFPEYLIVNYNDPKINTDEILKSINIDPWLHSTGIIVLMKKEFLDNVPEIFNNLNILSFLNIDDFETQLDRILKIVLTNKQVLIQKDFAQNILEKRSGSFLIDNDPSMINSYVNIVSTVLVNEKYINSNKANALRIALTELIMNAIEHGNCDVDYDEKTKFLEGGGNINELIRIKLKDPEIAKKKVKFDYTITDQKLLFVIKDEGPGFDHKKASYNPDNEEDLWQMHGRGIFLTKIYVDSLTYNDKGNEATIQMKTDRDTKTVPQGFLSQKELILKSGDIVFNEGEKSNNLYYIVNGIYEISVKGKVLAELNPSDVFLGEMSFLLNNKRVATVTAKTEGKLIEITKNSFINILKKYPHYGVFLSKLLAKRLEISNSKKVE